MEVGHGVHWAWSHSPLIDGVAPLDQQTCHARKTKAWSHRQQNHVFLLHMLNRPTIAMFGMHCWFADSSELRIIYLPCGELLWLPVCLSVCPCCIHESWYVSEWLNGLSWFSKRCVLREFMGLPKIKDIFPITLPQTVESGIFSLFIAVPETLFGLLWRHKF